MNKYHRERTLCHAWIRELVEEEIQAREWTQPALIISQLAKTTLENADRLLRFDSRLTKIQCWMLDKAFGLSEGFFARLQENCEKREDLKTS